MPSPPRPPRRPPRQWLREHALALWLWGLGLLGVIRFAMRAMRDGTAADTVAWLYLGGGVLVFLAGTLAWIGSRRRDRGARDRH